METEIKTIEELIAVRKPSGKVELLIITQMPPFRTSWLYLVSPFTMQR